MLGDICQMIREADHRMYQQEKNHYRFIEKGENAMNYAEIKECDIANGPGVRMTLFVEQRCRHHCKNCFNEIAWDFNYGNVFDETVENALVEK